MYDNTFFMNNIMKDVIEKIAEDKLNEVIIQKVELVDGVSVELHIKRLQQHDADYMNEKYASVISKSIEDLTPKEMVLFNEYKYDIITKACVKPTFVKEDVF